MAEAENSIDKDIEIARRFPYSEMASYGWVEKTGRIEEKVINLRKFFGVIELTLLENNIITRITSRRLRVTEKSDLALMAWVEEAKIIARDIDVGEIDISRIHDIVPDLKNMTTMTPETFCPSLKKSLASCGIALVFLPHLKGSFLHGATFVEGRKIVIGLTTRGRDADKFWFSLFHELGHISLYHFKLMNGTTEKEEKDADIWAENALTDRTSYDSFVSEKKLQRSGDYRLCIENGNSSGYHRR